MDNLLFFSSKTVETRLESASTTTFSMTHLSSLHSIKTMKVVQHNQNRKLTVFLSSWVNPSVLRSVLVYYSRHVPPSRNRRPDIGRLPPTPPTTTEVARGGGGERQPDRPTPSPSSVTAKACGGAKGREHRRFTNAWQAADLTTKSALLIERVSPPS